MPNPPAGPCPPLLFGVPSLDSLLRRGPESPDADADDAAAAGGIHLHWGEATTVALVGGDGTGKSVLAMHLAARYRADLQSAKAAGNAEIRARVLYISSDLSLPRAKTMWQDFGLDTTLRRICFCEGEGGVKELAGACPLTRLEPDDQVLTRLFEPGDIGPMFMDLTAGSTGDDWGYLSRLVAALPAPGRRARPHLMVIDSVDGLFRCGGRLDAFGQERDREDCLTELARLASGKCHLVLLAEEPDEGKRTREQYDANVVFRLRAETTGDIPRLTVEVEKTRGQQATPGRHELAFIGRPTTWVSGSTSPTNSFAHVYRSMGSDQSTSATKHELPTVIRPDAPLTGLPFLDRMVQPIGDEAGHITALIGDEGTHKLHLANAFLVAGVNRRDAADPGGEEREKQRGIGILVTTRRIKYADWLSRELRGVLGEDVNGEDRHFRYQRIGLGQRTFSAERFIHLIRRSICHAAALVDKAKWSVEHECWPEMAARHRAGDLRDYKIRLVIDDLSRLLHDYPDVAQQAQFIKELERLIKKTGVQAMLVDTQRGQPGSVLREERDALLRSMADQVLYTWHVPFMGGSVVALTAVPAAQRGHHATIAELRLHTEDDFKGSSRLVVDPHLDMFDGLDKAEPAPTPVQLRVHLYSETEASTVYHDHARRWLNQSVPATKQRLVITDTPDDYEELRNISYASGGTRYGHTQVLQVDEWWSDSNGSLLSMLDYFDREVYGDRLEDPYGLFQSGYERKPRQGRQQRRRLDCILDRELGFGYAELLGQHRALIDRLKAKLAVPANDAVRPPLVDRFPYSWDFGFLMLQREAWKLAIRCKVDRAERIYKALTDPFLTGGEVDPTVTWEDFEMVSRAVAANWPDHPQARALSVSTSSPGTAACLLLEIWANESAGKCPLALPRQEVARTSLLDHAKRDVPALVRAARRLLALLVGDGVTVSASPDWPTVARRHWYATASAELAKPEQQGRWVPALLPGEYSVRGDWFLGIGSGSRSVVLARRAIDQLCSHRANSDRLHYGIGLPVRRQYEAMSDVGRIGAGQTTLTDDLGQTLPYSVVEQAALGAYGETGKGDWLWRSTIKHYARHNRVWTQWVAQLLRGWPTASKQDDEWLSRQVDVLIEAFQAMEPEPA